MSKRKVVLTGASGIIAGGLLPYLQERYDLLPLDINTTSRYTGEEVEGVQIVDLMDTNRDNYRQYFEGADAVIHCGFLRGDRSKPDEYFDAEYGNIRFAYNIYQVALEAGVRRVVTASSNHAADWYEPRILDGEWDFVTPDMKPYSDNYYGWAKDVYEHLGFVFACGQVNDKPLENVHIRIGGPRETDVERCEKGDLRCVRRALAVYISPRDHAQLFFKSIETEDIRNEFGIPFQIFYGISDNDHAFWSIANARKVIGYAPEDNSAVRFRHLIQEHMEAAKAQGKIE